MTPVAAPPSFITNVFTLGIARAKWISQANSALGHSTGFLFAYFLQAFANYGLAGRLNAALAAAGSSHTESPVLCWFLTGFPLIGAKKRMTRGFATLNDARSIGQRVAV